MLHQIAAQDLLVVGISVLFEYMSLIMFMWLPQHARDCKRQVSSLTHIGPGGINQGKFQFNSVYCINHHV